MHLLKQILNRKMLAVLLLGISSGMPLLLIGSTLKAWLRKSGVDLTVIGFFGIVGLPYTLKFLWSPLFDRYALPFLDRRRGWIVLFQIVLAALLALMAFQDPAAGQGTLGIITFFIALASASQDIVIDAYRRDILEDSDLAMGAALGVNGYRLGMTFIAGALALFTADFYGWSAAYLVMAAIMLLLVVATVFSPPLTDSIPAPRNFQEAVIEPFKDFFRRNGAFEILIFILLYKIGDSMASDNFTVLYVDLGFSLSEIAAVSKLYGFWSVLLGGLIGGIVVIRIGMLPSLWIFGFLQAVSTACFSWLASAGHNVIGLAGVITFENLTSGMGTAAYVGFMASLCNRRFSATQYALLSSFMGVPRVFMGAWSGYLAKQMGYSEYFIFCALIAIPGMLMLLRARKWIVEKPAFQQ